MSNAGQRIESHHDHVVRFLGSQESATKENQAQGLGEVIPKVLLECGNGHQIIEVTTGELPCFYNFLYMFPYVFRDFGELSSCQVMIPPFFQTCAKAIFRRIDEDGSGQVTFEELLEGARKDKEFQSRQGGLSPSQVYGDN